MARFTAKCPKCEHEESVISTSLGAEMPPCPRCEDFVRMANVTPVGDQTKVISTSGAQTADAPQPTTPLPDASPQPKKRDMRDWGPEPRS